MSHPAVSPPSPAQAPRFSWPMRILLFVILFHMFFRTTDILYPWEGWLPELKLKRMPHGLPTRDEMTSLRAKADGSNELVHQEFKKCGTSLVRYWNPMPTEETRKQLTSSARWGQYGLAWTASRLQWCECIVGIDQEWAMFSPNVGKRRWATRARLRFEDGTEVTIRSRSEPEDLTSYFRGNAGKNLGYDRMVFDDNHMRFEACPGYGNFLAHRFPENAAGSPLQAIILYTVKFDFVPPGADAHEFLRDQMEKTRDYSSRQAYWAFFVYAPQNRSWKFLRRERDAGDEPAFYSLASDDTQWRYLGSRDFYPLPAYPEKFQNLDDLAPPPSR